MTPSSQFSASMISARSEQVRDADRPMPPGVGLGIGLVTSLGLWAGVAHVVMRLIG